MSRLDQYDVSVSIDGTNLGTFDKMAGGNIDSTETKYKPGNMAPQMSLGGSVEVSNVTVSRLYDLSRDHSRVPFLKGKVGKGTVVVRKQPLDVNGTPFGTPVVYTGKMKSLNMPEPDSESSAAAIMEIEVSTVGMVTA
jgi:hypothetical protein